MMSGLRSQRDRMMTWVSLRSGVASRGKCVIDHVPQMHAAATKAKMRNLFRTEKLMRRLIILASRSGLCRASQPIFCILCGILQEFLMVLVRAENKSLSTIGFRVTIGKG